MTKTEYERDQALVKKTRNTARYFTENRQVAWVLLASTLLWGLFAYRAMPKRKDPLIEIRQAVANCVWPGASAERVEQLLTRRIEQQMAGNTKIEKIESISRTSISTVYVTLREDVTDRAKEFEDIKSRLDGIRDLPQGAGPVQFIKDFGDTATLMLTVATPRASEVELELRARSIARAIEEVRKSSEVVGERATVLVAFPPAIANTSLRRVGQVVLDVLQARNPGGDTRLIEGPGFLGIDTATKLGDEALLAQLWNVATGRIRLSELHPDVWKPTVVRDPSQTLEKLRSVAEGRYSHRQIDEATDLLQRSLQAEPLVAKVVRVGVLPEQVTLSYSQERLATYGISPARLADVLSTRNITASGGVLEVGGKSVTVDPSGEFRTAEEIGEVTVGRTPAGAPLYLRELVDISREYLNPPRFLNTLTLRDTDGTLRRQPAITLSVQMRPGAQIADFGEAVGHRIDEVAKLIPDGMVIRRTSDQPLQVAENVSLFMGSLLEAIILVIGVAFVGFWDWRTALLMALSIPLTLAMTFGMMQLCGIDIQQISIASLILALGLLVDDPVVAGDAIKRSLGDGWKGVIAAWLGPTKLAGAILFATLTNIAAYLPLLAVPGDVGIFIYSLPIVLTLSLVASRIISMTFVPLLGYVLLRPPLELTPSRAQSRRRGFGRIYSRLVAWSVDHRNLFLLATAAVLVVGLGLASRIRPSFFPIDRQYLFYADVWLPEDATLQATRERAEEVSAVIAEVCEKHGATLRRPADEPLLESITEFIGGGGPRFWFSVPPEQPQLNYAQLVVQVSDKEETATLLPIVQKAVTERIAGATVDIRPLETGKTVGIPVGWRVSGEDIATLRGIAEKLKAILRELPNAERVRDNWGADSFSVSLKVDPDRASMAGVTNLDVAMSAATAMSGWRVATLREADRQIPIVVRLRSEERAQLGDVENLYIKAQSGAGQVPLRQVSDVVYGLKTERIHRRNQFRTISVGAFPTDGTLPSEVVKKARPKVEQLARELPPGYWIELGGAAEQQKKSFASLAAVLGISVAAIFLALVIQFKNGIKPLIVFATLPFGAVAAVDSLVLMRAPFSFMAFLGVISLMGVIVSHIIVLFDFIEEMREEGEPLREALIDAGIARLRPVLVTVGATILGLVPLALHGGPLWEPLCYAQIGGLTAATAITLLLVPVLYTVAVKDLGWVTWHEAHEEPEERTQAGA